MAPTRTEWRVRILRTINFLGNPPCLLRGVPKLPTFCVVLAHRDSCLLGRMMRSGSTLWGLYVKQLTAYPCRQSPAYLLLAYTSKGAVAPIFQTFTSSPVFASHHKARRQGFQLTIRTHHRSGAGTCPDNTWPTVTPGLKLGKRRERWLSAVAPSKPSE